MESGYSCGRLLAVAVCGCWGVVSTPSKARSASVLSMFLLPPHPKSRSPWLSLCMLTSPVVCGLLSLAWEPAGKIKSALQEGIKQPHTTFGVSPWARTGGSPCHDVRGCERPLSSVSLATPWPLWLCRSWCQALGAGMRSPFPPSRTAGIWVGQELPHVSCPGRFPLHPLSRW